MSGPRPQAAKTEPEASDQEPRLRVVLVEPRIPPNTGNVARLCAAMEVPLHLVGPLGFEISDRHLKRAGLDYWQWVELRQHDSLAEYLDWDGPDHLLFFSTHAEQSYLKAPFSPRSRLIFGSETQGLPDWLRKRHPERFFRVPIRNPNVRSLNLSSTVAIVLFEALRQTGRI